MNINPKPGENKEKINSPDKENNEKPKEQEDTNIDNNNVAPKLESQSTSISSSIMPIEKRPKNNTIKEKIRFTTSIIYHKENKEKKENEAHKNNPILMSKIKDGNLNI